MKTRYTMTELAEGESHGAEQEPQPSEAAPGRHLMTDPPEYESAMDRLRADMARNSKQKFRASAGAIALATTILSLMIAAD